VTYTELPGGNRFLMPELPTTSFNKLLDPMGEPARRDHGVRTGFFNSNNYEPTKWLMGVIMVLWYF
jgi:hypothetical protein